MDNENNMDRNRDRNDRHINHIVNNNSTSHNTHIQVVNIPAVQITMIILANCGVQMGIQQERWNSFQFNYVYFVINYVMYYLRWMCSFFVVQIWVFIA